jgi:hypothetical protein
MTRENGSEKNLPRDEFGNHSGNDSGNPIWRDGAMSELHIPQPHFSETHRPFQALCDHVASMARSPEAARLAARIAPSQGTPRDSPDLLELLARRDADGRPAIRVVERLAKEAPKNPLAALGLLSMLRGDLEVVSDRLIRSGRVSTLDAASDALGAAWEVVTRRPAPGRWERGDAIWNQARRVSRARRRDSLRIEPLPEDYVTASNDMAVDDMASNDMVIDDWTQADSGWPGRPPALLAAAVAAGVLTPREVVLIARTRIEGRTLRQVAKSLGRPYEAAKKERQRAEAALRTFVWRYDSDGSS